MDVQAVQVRVLALFLCYAELIDKTKKIDIMIILHICKIICKLPSFDLQCAQYYLKSHVKETKLPKLPH